MAPHLPHLLSLFLFQIIRFVAFLDLCLLEVVSMDLVSWQLIVSHLILMDCKNHPINDFSLKEKVRVQLLAQRECSYVI